MKLWQLSDAAVWQFEFVVTVRNELVVAMGEILKLLSPKTGGANCLRLPLMVMACKKAGKNNQRCVNSRRAVPAREAQEESVGGFCRRLSTGGNQTKLQRRWQSRWWALTSSFPDVNTEAGRGCR